MFNHLLLFLPVSAIFLFWISKLLTTVYFQLLKPKILCYSCLFSFFYIPQPTCQQILLALPSKYIQKLTTSHISAVKSPASLTRIISIAFETGFLLPPAPLESTLNCGRKGPVKVQVKLCYLLIKIFQELSISLGIKAEVFTLCLLCYFSELISYYFTPCSLCFSHAILLAVLWRCVVHSMKPWYVFLFNHPLAGSPVFRSLFKYLLFS